MYIRATKRKRLNWKKIDQQKGQIGFNKYTIENIRDANKHMQMCTVRTVLQKCPFSWINKDKTNKMILF